MDLSEKIIGFNTGSVELLLKMAVFCSPKMQMKNLYSIGGAGYIMKWAKMQYKERCVKNERAV